ncbi:thioredoxin [Deinococcus lacus]|uniref:Thioredoxin n=1 Tax=Deinococcus lacus TaxID=392561 RepID=A0ABW1YE51_9DEIO
MTDAPFLLLTQDACPQCERLKLMLSAPLKGKFDRQIEVLHRQQQPDDFASVAEQYGVRATPVLIHRASGQVLSETGGLGAVKAFLEQA